MTTKTTHYFYRTALTLCSPLHNYTKSAVSFDMYSHPPPLRKNPVTPPGASLLLELETFVKDTYLTFIVRNHWEE